jgi:hypothetical protein
MKSNLLKLLIFVSIVFLLDRIGGIICKDLYSKSNDYTIYRLHYTLDSTKEDILVFGSSRAQYHFVPAIISQNTGLSVYNCGFGGEGLLFSLIQLKESLKRYKPKLVVLEVSPNVLIDPESNKKLKILMPFSKKDPFIFEALTSEEKLEKVKLLSSIYPYNSTIASLLTGRFKQNVDTLNGFWPLDGIMDTVGVTNYMKASFPNSTISAEQTSLLHQFISVCDKNDIKVAVVVSPVYQSNGNLDAMTKLVERKCQGYKNLSFFDYSKYDTTYQRNVFFKDNLHLNYQGARIFSEVISKRLNDILLQEPNKLTAGEQQGHTLLVGDISGTHE